MRLISACRGFDSHVLGELRPLWSRCGDLVEQKFIESCRRSVFFIAFSYPGKQLPIADSQQRSHRLFPYSDRNMDNCGEADHTTFFIFGN